MKWNRPGARLVIRLLGLGTALLCSAPQGMEARFTYTGEANLAQESAADGGSHLVKFSNRLDGEFAAEAGAGWKWFARAAVSSETRDLIEPGEPDDSAVRSKLSRRLFFNDYSEFELRELFVDGYLNDVFVRAGKQQVVWGQADGFRVLDVVNPMNLREFILEDSEDRRIPTWMLNLEVPVGQWMAQFLWIPDTTYDQVPSLQDKARFAPTSPLFVPYPAAPGPVRVSPADKPRQFFGDSDAGARINGFIGGWDLSLNYFYHYLDRPAPYQTPSGEVFVIAPAYERSHLLGGTLSTVYGDLTLRGELAAHSERYFITRNATTDNQGILSSAAVESVLGLDYNGFSDTFISAQVFVSRILDHDPGMTVSATQSTTSLLVERVYLNQTVTLGGQWFQSLNDSDGLLRLSVDYRWRSHIIFSAGLDAFYSDDLGLFGQFDGRDGISFGVSIDL
ncbi:DUF1302 family protein [Parahaliea aestuarii]|uniref:DUF1302 domain-containing protein n=1 Tax=Parahaliea aestuarii TaxID=1852021 RepID=A0A5C8ZTF2_9GAMM|nr:DUF1302 family protein [Parahaliea aestuarii]TXS91783.1 hypothetical protein FVW59_11570 [Parahaliea aestuarii]